jgi:hypothetical protein
MGGDAGTALSPERYHRRLRLRGHGENMNNHTPIIERAFQLAESGECDSFTHIKSRLKSDGYTSIEAGLTGSSLRRQLSAICTAKRAGKE